MATRKPKGSTADSEFKPNGSRGVAQEKSILMTLKDMVKTDTKAYYIMFLYCPELLPKYSEERPIKTFEDLKKAYSQSIRAEERMCKNFLFEENVQKAIMWLKKRQHTQEMISLYDTYLSKAKGGDINAFKAIVDFGDKFFTDDGESDLLKALHGVSLDGQDTPDDEDMDFDFRNK